MAQNGMAPNKNAFHKTMANHMDFHKRSLRDDILYSCVSKKIVVPLIEDFSSGDLSVDLPI